MKPMECTYPWCATSGRCRVTACPGDHQCAAMLPRTDVEASELAARIPLGDKVWKP